jgi:hypothetical protein
MAQDLDVNPVENASATLYEARVLITAAEALSRDTRAWLEHTNAGESAKRSLTDVDTMLGVIADYISNAKDTIDKFVDDAFAARRSAAE